MIGGGGGAGLKLFTCQTQHRLYHVELRLSWGFDNMEVLNQLARISAPPPFELITLIPLEPNVGLT